MTVVVVVVVVVVGWEGEGKAWQDQDSPGQERGWGTVSSRVVVLAVPIEEGEGPAILACLHWLYSVTE